jgi:hypothetical protein
MFTRLVAAALCLAPLGPVQGQERMSRGVWAVPCIVVAVHPDELEVSIDGEKFPGAGGATFKLQVTKETVLEVVDSEVKGGKSSLSTKRIALKELHQTQPVSAVFYSDGKEMTLLRAVASGPMLSGKNLPVLVEKLGGKVKRQDWRVEKSVLYTVDLKGTKVTDEDLHLLGSMRGMASLDLSFTGITDKGIAHLAGAAELSNLELTATKVTDAAVPGPATNSQAQQSRFPADRHHRQGRAPAG